MVTYSWIVEDLSGNLIAPNDITNPVAFYEGWFESNYYYECNNANLTYDAQHQYVGCWLVYSSDEWYLYDNAVSDKQAYSLAEMR